MNLPSEPRWKRAEINLEHEHWALQLLTCPHCRGPYLHHGAVRCYDREEDAEVTTVSTVADGQCSVKLLPSNAVRNPSGRRHGLAIAFECEGCASYLELTLAQHKGISMLEWRFLPADPNPGDEARSGVYPMLRDEPVR
jgi:hypothetical protein